jgi:hypothetical protein
MEKKPDYPVELTEAAWQKDKGLIAKMVVDTGIGKALRRTRQAYDAVDWTAVTQQGFRLKAKYKDATLKTIADAEAAYKRKRPALVNFVKELKNLEILVTRSHQKFKSSKVIPDSSVKHVAAVLTKAKGMAERCDPEDADKAIDTDIAAFIRQVHDRAAAKDYIDAIIDNSRALQKFMIEWHKKPDVQEVNADLRQQRRMLEVLMESINEALRNHREHDFGPHPDFSILERFIAMKQYPDSATAKDIQRDMQEINRTYITKLKAWLKFWVAGCKSTGRHESKQVCCRRRVGAAS